ncbi:bifunctional 4-hydroxy-3-methylbut-2-enyl diphosphate reductase/30S ribosomal protein S1 [Alkalibacter saccharofermentans]|uniref:4-hydroxy-3-methylbut-2-enyl diphosphate reductase n=1 Tax=Alkalibacter saccharofermentans DSM 14828 TaxID=1120975 RepID=A0A1M4Z5F1_9FIRM|nr:bifunctional 4-hydroxy-3-methylbut-2-enyl diphosphate reductase/30S ribosomal protein S1 [Alkalibacter saccharofermentans]SHF13261.1 4-hydroxy-3-methylbut-2-enyl diphosphate reductase [Alkalibacter saccharofermentans DSM 14828]
MKIILAKSAGYCFGVNQAMKKVEDALEKGDDNIFTLGPLIHNRQVTDKLEQQGVKIISDVGSARGGVITVRSHGVGADIIEEIAESGIELIDATCPYVKKIHNKVKEYYQKDYKIFIVGDRAHPEVIGINGWCDYKGEVINDKNSVPIDQKYDKICVVAQTTMNRGIFEEISEEIKKLYPEAIILNTICNATKTRQEETAQIAKESDCMIIVGGRHSSNTKKLADIGRKHCEKTVHIETADELDLDILKGCDTVGITAGASTPHWIIKEVINKMTKSFEEMLKDSEMEASYEETFRRLGKGSIVTGKVIGVNKNEIYLNINYKADAILSKDEYTDEDIDLTEEVKVEDEIEVMVTNLNDGNGNVEVSKKKIIQKKASEELYNAFNEKRLLEGSVIKAVKGGLIVDLGLGQAFMPASQYHMRFVKDLETLVGKSVKGLIIEFDKRKNRVIFSQKVVLEQEYKEKKEQETKAKDEFINSVEIENILEGPIKSITNFGIFVKVGPIDGFVHISDLSWARVKHPSDMYKIGDEVKAVVTEVNKEEYKIKMSIKELSEEPWTVFSKKYNTGDEVDVKITRIAPFGAFAEIMEEVEGLIHISELSHDKVAKVEDVLNAGDQVTAKIIGINDEQKKISLSIKELVAEPAKEIEVNETVYEDESDNSIGNILGDIFDQQDK